MEAVDKPPIVEITWTDSTTHGGWMDLDEANDSMAMMCTTVGYIVKKSRKQVTLAQSISANGQMGEILCVPTSVIQELREL